MSVKAINKEEFDNLVRNGGVCLVDFWATWCSPCMMLAPVIEEVSEEFSDGIEFYKVNVDEHAELAMEFKIMSIPTILVFKNGEVAGKLVGMRDKQEYIDLIEGIL